MLLDGWPHSDSPFHEGERELQERVGKRAVVEKIGRRMIRDHMPDEHRVFFGTLPFLFVGSVDRDGRPWASIVSGEPGFVSTPDERMLSIAARPLPGDPLGENVASGAEIGLVGLEFHSRRRNRLNGTVAHTDATGFAVAVKQSFGNCPQYIQARHPEPLGRDHAPDAETQARRASELDDDARSLIETADTFFIASRHDGAPEDPRHGVDMSHRGGKPGFVRIEDARTLVWPEFHGNYHFNTLGNLLVDPRAGLLFVDFESGDLVQLTGTAELIWAGETVDAFEGAQRMVRFRIDEAVHLPAALAFRWHFEEASPVLRRTGSWQQADETLGAISPAE
jgi:predicted pyridoxine 5'-phosphate oxidase superfamily flavin-nucleotide-binding protein